MGRSGTSIVTKLLAELGLFVGKKKNPITYEAQFFQMINKWLLASCGGGLEHPTSIRHLLRDSQVRAIVTDFIRFVLRTPKSISFLGLWNYVNYHTPENLNLPWGWKDPRTTFTLPLWLDIFPSARVIHVYRHGVDVANSLKVGHEKIVTTIQTRLRRFGCLYQLYWLWKHLPRRRELIEVRTSTMEGAFSLWEEYIAEARNHVGHLRERAIEIQFEHLMEEPMQILKQSAEFCELSVTCALLQKVSGMIRRERAYAYETDEELKDFSVNVHTQLSRYGY